jgi:hypothetical protein
MRSSLEAKQKAQPMSSCAQTFFYPLIAAAEA